MSSRRDSQTTTEEYQTPLGGASAAGSPILLCVFPQEIAMPLPVSGAPVGRAWLAEAGIPDSKASGEHLSFSRRAGRVHVEDPGSRNGTWVNGDPIPRKKPIALDDGDLLRLGCTMFVYRAAFSGSTSPDSPIGKLTGPWGLREVRARLGALSPNREQNVLIEGETGTGKELLAAAVIHALGRARKPSASINVAAIPAGVFEGQLFGWDKNAYSGAAQAKKGIFRDNDGGSVFLDEIGELPLELQPKLLRLIEYRQVQPVGGSPVSVDIAIIAATNRALTDAVEKGTFRRDLLARFTERIVLPPLADRPEDVLAILQALAKRHDATIDPSRVEVAAVERLLLDEWRANVRDLDRVAAACAAEGQLSFSLVERILGPRATRGELTREDAQRMVDECGGNEHAAATRFGVKRGKLRRALGKVGKSGRVS